MPPAGKPLVPGLKAAYPYSYPDESPSRERNLQLASLPVFILDSRPPAGKPRVRKLKAACPCRYFYESRSRRAPRGFDHIDQRPASALMLAAGRLTPPSTLQASSPSKVPLSSLPPRRYAALTLDYIFRRPPSDDLAALPLSFSEVMSGFKHQLHHVSTSAHRQILYRSSSRERRLYATPDIEYTTHRRPPSGVFVLNSVSLFNLYKPDFKLSNCDFSASAECDFSRALSAEILLKTSRSAESDERQGKFAMRFAYNRKPSNSVRAHLNYNAKT
ncbi:hypothetical protein R3P38DRAFT_3253486 [Favolaschia claudopus]|uniref:Uncharacterized protein n=1 Tax=Favolaschia claudopus TaxID=2862362 RepID=A0AAW0DUV2_9AGAR